MFGTTNFQILHGSDLAMHMGEYYMSGDHFYGQWVDQSADDAGYIVPATIGTLGVLSQDVSTTEPTYEQTSLGYTNLASPSGRTVTVIALLPGAMLEIESEPSIAYDTAGEYRLVTSGAGAISASTAMNVELGVQNGRLRVAQTGDLIVARVINSAMTPETDDNIKIRVERIAGGKKA